MLVAQRTLSSVVPKSLRFSPEAIAARKDRKKQKRSIENIESVPKFYKILENYNIKKEHTNRNEISTLQVNIGLTCNMSCSHCHVESTPTRTETLGENEAKRIIELLKSSPSIKTLDITGGAPEMHSQFKYLVKEARKLNIEVIDRCNLTIAVQPGYEWIIPFLAENNVTVTASMPCYLPENVEKQRGDHSFDDSIKALQLLNKYNYGKKDSNLILNLVYNPIGPFLPPNQKSLEELYKKNLYNSFNIEFNELFTITNMPIKRFADDLKQTGKLEEYMNMLISNFNPTNISDIMCRSTVHVDYNGLISDCDFNSALEITSGADKKNNGLSIFEIENLDFLINQPINHGKHCLGCIAGAGSS